MSETLWKKKFDSPKPEGFEGFHTAEGFQSHSMYDDILKMQDKIKNMYNRKKARTHKENYKNIELFQNIYDKMMQSSREEEDSSDNESDTEGYANYNESDEEELSDNEDDNESTDDNENEVEGFVEGLKSKSKSKKKPKAKSKAAPKPAPTKNVASNAKGTTAKGVKGAGAAATATANADSAATKTSTLDTIRNMEIRNIDDLKKVAGLIISLFSSSISDFLFYLPKQVDSGLTSGTTNFAKVFSEEKASPNNIKKDANILKQFIYQLIAYAVAIWVAFNWVFIMVFKGPEIMCGDTKDSKGRCHPLNDESRFKINFNNTGSFQSILEFLLDFAIMPSWVFDKFVIGDKYGKTIFSQVPWKIISHMIILTLSYFLVYSYDFFSSIKDTIDGKFKTVNFFATACIGALLLNRGVVEPVKNRLVSADAVKSFLLKLMSPLTWIFLAFIYFVILLGIAALSINISVIVLILFIWFASIFTIPYYSGWSISSIMRTISSIQDYISEDFDNDEENYKDIGIFQKILRAIAKAIHTNMYYVGAIVLLLYNLINMNLTMNSLQLRIVVSTLLSSILFLVSMFVVNNNKGDDTSARAPKPDMKPIPIVVVKPTEVLATPTAVKPTTTVVKPTTTTTEAPTTTTEAPTTTTTENIQI